MKCKYIKRDNLVSKIEEEAGKEKEGTWQRQRWRREAAHWQE